MKARATGTTETFNPVTIEITFESLAEAEALHDIFNNVEILNACNGLDGEPIRRSIEKAVGKNSFFQTTTWGKFYSKMKENYASLLKF